MARPEKIRLGEMLVQQGLIRDEQLQQALEEQRSTGRKLGRVLVDKRFVTDQQIAGALARQLGVPFINLVEYRLDPDTVRLLPETQARRFRAVVLEKRSDAIVVGLSDPLDLFAYDEIARILKSNIDLAVVIESEVLHVIDRVYRRTQEISSLAKVLETDLGDVLDFNQMLVGSGQEDAPVVRLLQSVFDDAVQVRASDIHIEPQEGRLQIRFRIDGILHLQTTADIKIAPSLALRLKLISGLDISEKRLPQDGRFVVRSRKQPIDVRISTMPTQYGESVVMRLLNNASGIISLNQIGMPPAMLERYRQIISRPNGLVLVTGPTGSGKTTTLYATLDELNSPETKIITVEDPVEYRLDGITQVQVHEKIDLSFSRVLRSTLRQDPDIILVGEMRDHETAQIGLRAAMTGHMVLSTLHTNDAASTPVRLIDMGVPRYLVATSLQAVLAQRLVRLICEQCAQPVIPDPHEAEWLQLRLGDRASQLIHRHGQGCTACNGTGYAGRVGVYELLEMTRDLINAANHGDPSHFIRAAREQMGEHSLQNHAAQLVFQGLTTASEAMRISHQFED